MMFLIVAASPEASMSASNLDSTFLTKDVQQLAPFEETERTIKNPNIDRNRTN